MGERNRIEPSDPRAALASRLPVYGDDQASWSERAAWPDGDAEGERLASVPPHASELPGTLAGLETQEGLRGLFGRDSVYLVVMASQAGLAALSIPITTRLLGGSGFAVVTTSLAVMQVLVAIGVFSLPMSVQRNYRPEDGGQDARKTVSLAIITSGLMLVVAVATGPLWSPALNLGPFNAARQYAVIWASLTAVTFAAIALLRSRNRLRAYAVVSVIQSLIAEVLSVLLVVLVRRTAAEFILGEMIAQGAAAAFALYVARPMWLRRQDLALVLRSLKYSGALVPAALSGFLLTTADRIILARYLPQLQVARYGAVYNVAAIPLLLLGLLDGVWLPRFFALRDESVRSELLSASRDALYRLLIPVVLGLAFGIPLVLSVWVPHNYHPAGLVLVVITISVGAFPMTGYIAANRVLLISGRTVPVGFCTALTAAFNIAANIALDPHLGIEGAALATSLAFVVLQVLTLFFAHRVQRLTPPPPSLIASCLAAVAIALGCTLVGATGVLAAARVVLTLACLVVFAVELQALIAPTRIPAWMPGAQRLRRGL